MDFSSLLLIFSIILVSGVIAYLGDILGRRIGKRRLSLLKLRPRYTAIVVSIATGLLISAITLVILSVASEDVRTALFGMAELKERLAALNHEVLEQNVELEANRREAEQHRRQIGELEERERNLQASRIGLEEQLSTLSINVEDLRGQRDQLREEIQTQLTELSRLRASLMAIRRGEIIFHDEEEILRATAPAGMNGSEAEAFLVSLVHSGDEVVMLEGAGQDVENQRSIFILEDNFSQTQELLTNSADEYVIRLVATINVVRGEPVISRFLSDVNRKVVADGEVMLSRFFTVEAGQTNIELLLGELLRDLNTLGARRGILPQRGRVGIISAINLSEITRSLETMSGDVLIETIAVGDIYTIGPLRVRLQIGNEEAPQGEGD
ncbi:MAG TPA: DUF3084 domain-containing protein [Atribacteraceae bacterium]|nr:DUF3084 domain-containing protein [Atribacteraceae bacterium]